MTRVYRPKRALRRSRWQIFDVSRPRTAACSRFDCATDKVAPPRFGGQALVKDERGLACGSRRNALRC